jgi:hypothetical protein
VWSALIAQWQPPRDAPLDLCLIRMSELYPRHSVITVDREDFRVYRRNKRETIPLICPPFVDSGPRQSAGFPPPESVQLAK